MSRARKWVVAMDVGATHVSAGLVSSSGDVLAAREIASRPAGEETSLRRRLIDLAGELIEAAAAERVRPLGIAVGAPGIVDFKKGVLVVAGNLPELFGAPLGPELTEAFGLPAIVENDVNALAVGEMVFGVARDAADFVVFAVGTDLGGGIVIGGKLHRGAHHIAAEFGHLTLELSGQACVCGGHGCAREYVSGAGLAAQAAAGEVSAAVLELAQGRPEAITAAHVFEAARRGDPQATALALEFTRRFGAVISDVMKVLDPELVVLAGPVIMSEPGLINDLIHWVRHFYFPLPQLPDFRVSELTKKTAILGPAAVFFVERGVPAGPTVGRRPQQG